MTEWRLSRVLDLVPRLSGLVSGLMADNLTRCATERRESAIRGAADGLGVLLRFGVARLRSSIIAGVKSTLLSQLVVELLKFGVLCWRGLDLQGQYLVSCRVAG